MNNYETVFIASNKISDEQRKNVFEKFKKLISTNGTISSTEELGEKKLAYEIRKHSKGFYYVIKFEAESSFIAELERVYRITDEIIKFMVVKEDKKKGR